ncbi:MAG: oxidoreductase C-terminal domain-containing protein, partial [Pseudomonadota bacterium]
VKNGIRVDQYLRASEPGIFALGDCACFPDPRSRQMVRLESVQAAVDHAKTIADVIVNGPTTPYAAVPWFWSDQSDWKLQIAGLASATDRAVMADPFSCLRFDRDDRLTAVETINGAKVHMTARKILERSERPSFAELQALQFDVVSWRKAADLALT